MTLSFTPGSLASTLALCAILILEATQKCNRKDVQESAWHLALLRCRGLLSLQGLLDSYYSKAMATGEDEKRQAECTKQAGQIVDAFNELLPVRAAEKRASAAAAAAHASSKKGAGKKHDRKGKKDAGAGNVGEKGPKGVKRTLQQSKHARK